MLDCTLIDSTVVSYLLTLFMYVYFVFYDNTDADTDHPPGAAFSDWIYFTQKELDFTSSTTSTAAGSSTGTHSRRA
jgi:hypothetical protein